MDPMMDNRKNGQGETGVKNMKRCIKLNTCLRVQRFRAYDFQL